MENETDRATRAATPLRTGLAVAFGTYLIILTIVELASIIAMWPGSEVRGVDWWPFNVFFTPEQKLFVLVILSGAAGTTLALDVYFVKLATGDKLLSRSGWWFGVPPFIGALGGFIVYLVVRGGLLKADHPVDALNPYVVCALAALAGVKWQSVIDILDKYAGTFFSSGKGADKTGSGNNHDA